MAVIAFICVAWLLFAQIGLIWAGEISWYWVMSRKPHHTLLVALLTWPLELREARRWHAKYGLTRESHARQLAAMSEEQLRDHINRSWDQWE